MTNLIPFETAKLPAHFANLFGEFKNDLASGGTGFPVISIKGKVFTIKRGDDKTIITRPESDDPASSIEVVILKAYPEGGKTAKVYYNSGYTEGSDASPTCYSNDGVSPASDAAEPQSSKCATCARAVWGSKISEDGKKNKECGDAKRLAVAQVGALNDPILLRVPAASLKALTAHGDVLAKRGVPYQAVVTKIGFDYTVAHPALTFKPIGFLDESSLGEVVAAVNSDLVQQITGQVDRPKLADEFAPEPKAATKPTAKPASKKPELPDDDLPTEPPKTKVRVEGEEAPAPVAPKVEPKTEPKPAPKAATKPVVEDVDAGMAATLDDMDFDD